jgi:Pyruvate/2-oxoacid:ferredoxin oxidoreductase delta subunit
MQNKTLKAFLCKVWGKYFEASILTVIRAVSLGWRIKAIPKITLDWLHEKMKFGTQVIPVHEALHPGSRVAPYEEVKSLVKNSDVSAVIKCYCRMTTGNCDNPLDTCIVLGKRYARWMDDFIKRENIKTVPTGEVLRILDDCEKRGLVHMLLKWGDDKLAYNICNCCSCCCMPIKAYKSGASGMIEPSSFIAEQDYGRCTNCFTCVGRCAFDARKIDGGKLVYDSSACLGCGVCATGCKSGAVKLVRRPG